METTPETVKQICAQQSDVIDAAFTALTIPGQVVGGNIWSQRNDPTTPTGCTCRWKPDERLPTIEQVFTLKSCLTQDLGPVEIRTRAGMLEIKTQLPAGAA